MLAPGSAAKKPPVFLDRDGTLIVEKGYLRDPHEVHLESGVAAGLSSLQENGHPLVVLSNQSGIGRGMLTEAEARQVNARADQLLRAQGINVLGWYYCPHAPGDACDCRKPLPGLARRAARAHRIELAGSYVVGDKRSDVELAGAIGGTGILVTTGHGAADREWAEEHAHPVFGGFSAAAAFIISRVNGR